MSGCVNCLICVRERADPVVTSPQDRQVCVYIQGEDVYTQVSHRSKSKLLLLMSRLTFHTVHLCVCVHLKVCPVGFSASSCVFTKVCKVDEGLFDLQNRTYLESGARKR